MTRSNFLSGLLFSIFERGEGHLSARDGRSFMELCAALMSERGEASGSKIAAVILDRYAELDDKGKKEFFSLLTEEYDIDTDAVLKSAAAYAASKDGADLAKVMREAEPRRQELFRRLNRAPGATGALVRMRSDLLGYLKENPSFRRTDLDFDHLFASWFNRGFLVLRRIDWNTPAKILEKIIQYEAVHAIGDWDDLRRRLVPDDRRCFAFFHPSMPDDPLIFVEVALTAKMADSIQDVLLEGREHVSEEEATTAVFYSISNCQRGLAGVSFGNFLIKQVVTDLSQELPNLRTFVTLSPLPGFNRWLATQATPNADHPDADEIREILETSSPEGLADKSAVLGRLTAEYLCAAKRDDGSPPDPVARFHLGNGARLERINPGADLSAKGMSESSGVMVNYMYDLKTVEANHEAYAQSREVVASKAVRALLRDRPAKANQRRPENA